MQNQYLIEACISICRIKPTAQKFILSQYLDQNVVDERFDGHKISAVNSTYFILKKN